MSRYIDADVVLSQYGEKHFNGEITSEEYYAIKIPIDYAQTADVRENEHGEWVDRSTYETSDGGKIAEAKCTNCNLYSSQINISGKISYKFCPRCGAMMG